MNNEYMTTRLVEFRDTDAAGMVHFASFFAYMESAEHELLRHVGLSVVMQDEHDGTISWPRVSASCDFEAPAKFEDRLEIGVRVAKIGSRSVRYAFQFRRADQTIAHGELTTVCCRVESGKTPQPIPIPDAIRKALQGYTTT